MSPEQPQVRPLVAGRPDPTPVDDVVDGALAVLAVAAALVRYAAETAARGHRSRLPRLPSVHATLGGPLGRVLAHPVSAAVRALSAVADVAVPEVTRAVLSRLDVTALVREHVDLDRLAATLDVDAVVARVDVQGIVDRVDVQGIVDRVDVQGIVDRVDVQGIVDRVDVQGIVDRVDVQG
ncbi:hypothetical protein, partial [Geodermatophilus sp. SYSU D00815]